MRRLISLLRGLCNTNSSSISLIEAATLRLALRIWRRRFLEQHRHHLPPRARRATRRPDSAQRPYAAQAPAPCHPRQPRWERRGQAMDQMLASLRQLGIGPCQLRLGHLDPARQLYRLISLANVFVLPLNRSQTTTQLNQRPSPRKRHTERAASSGSSSETTLRQVSHHSHHHRQHHLTAQVPMVRRCCPRRRLQ